MYLLHKTTAVTLALAMIVTVAAPVTANAQYRRGPEGRGSDGEDVGPGGRVDRSVIEREEGGWAVVDTRTVTGKVVVLSPAVGPEIDLEESIRFSVFHGPSLFNERSRARFLAASVSGYQEAMFMTRGEDRYAVRFAFSLAGETRYRMLRVKVEDMKKAREYIEHFDEIRAGTYKIQKKTVIPNDAEYPKVTAEDISFEIKVPRFTLVRRLDGGLTLRDGRELDGEILPALEDRHILIETGFDTQRISIENIESIRTTGNKGSSAMRTAVRNGIGGAMTGALFGVLVAWQSDGDVGNFAVFGSTIFGAVGFMTGFISGAGSGRGARQILLDPPSFRGSEDEQKD